LVGSSRGMPQHSVLTPFVTSKYRRGRRGTQLVAAHVASVKGLTTQQQVAELVSKSFHTRTQVRQLVAELVRQHVASVKALLGRLSLLAPPCVVLPRFVFSMLNVILTTLSTVILMLMGWF